MGEKTHFPAQVPPWVGRPSAGGSSSSSASEQATEAGALQDRLEPPWGSFGRGCHPNRDALATIGASPLEVVDTEQGSMPKAPAIVEPLITDEARLLLPT
jgi:hypothetical protein